MTRTFSVQCSEAMDKALTPTLDRLQEAGLKISSRQRLGANGLAKALLAHFLQQSPEDQLRIVTEGAKIYLEKFDA